MIDLSISVFDYLFIYTSLCVDLYFRLITCLMICPLFLKMFNWFLLCKFLPTKTHEVIRPTLGDGHIDRSSVNRAICELDSIVILRRIARSLPRGPKFLIYKKSQKFLNSNQNALFR